VADDDPRWWQSASGYAAMPLREWTRRLGALPAEAYDCLMVPIGFNRIQAWFAIDRSQWQAPLGLSCAQPPDRRQLAAVLTPTRQAELFFRPTLPCCVCRCACVIAFNINTPECLVRKEGTIAKPITLDQFTEENPKNPSLNSTLGCLKVVDTFREVEENLYQ
jgi:hypothetical protein